MTSDTPPAPHATTPHAAPDINPVIDKATRRRNSWQRIALSWGWLRWGACAAAGLAMVTAILLPLASIKVDDPVISWPKAGQPARSTVALFYPYRPLQLDVTIPCRALLNGHLGPVNVFSTFPPSSDLGHRYGLYITLRGGKLTFDANNQRLYTASGITRNCAFRLHGEGQVLTVKRDGKTVASSQTLVPQIAAFVTGLDIPAGTPGVSAVAHADARFQSSPTSGKSWLIAVTAALALVCAILPWILCRKVLPSRASPAPARQEPLRERFAASTLVITVLALWAVIGPSIDDDGYYTTMAANRSDTGYSGNYYAWLNTSETPFASSGWFHSWWVQLSETPLVMRIPSVLCGAVCWYLLRGIIKKMRRSCDGTVAPPLQAACFLCWWLPYDMTVRPEPLAALGIAVSTYAAVRCITGDSPAWLSLAMLSGGSALTVSATGLVAFIPPLFAAPGVLRRLPKRWDRIWLAGVLVAGTAAAVAVLTFSTTSLGQMLEATAAHHWYTLDFQWYDELQRYEGLVHSQEPMNSALRRLPILITLGTAAATMVLVRGKKPPFVLWFALGLAALVFTPSKWTHHFGALAVLGALALTYSIAGLQSAFIKCRSWKARAAAVLAVLVPLVVAWSGSNSWWSYSNWGMPAQGMLPFGVLVSSPAVLFTVLLGAVIAFRQILTTRRECTAREQAEPIGPLLGLTAQLMCRLSVYVAVIALLSMFTTASMATKNSWSLTQSTLSTLAGHPDCGLADKIHLTASDSNRLTGSNKPRQSAPLSKTISQEENTTFVDWPVSFFFSCAYRPSIADGLLRPPAYVITARQHQWTNDETRGGVLATLMAVANTGTLPTYVSGTDPASHTWGTFALVTYRYPLGQFDMTIDIRQRSGTWKGQTTAATDYSGRNPRWIRPQE
ncbi:arabinosyltransferase domain-containing protein [Streptomyces chartreusis]|uniref:arabinosyltransferase domain-containing protein n=1 Tax=Streptomyces chartreusis TaxID=1969 RepID=UPI003828495D